MSNINCTTPEAVRLYAPADTSALSLTLVSLVDSLLGWVERARERRTLATLDERMLRDIGLSRSDIAAETDKAFWQS